MTAKKRRRRRRPSRPAQEATGTPAVQEEPKSEPSEEEQPRRPGLFGGGRPSPYPPLGQSLARGLLPVGGSPAILIATFLSVLAMWGLLAGLGLPPAPQVMVLVLAVPPVSSSFDGLVAQSLFTEALPALGLIVALTILRAVTVSLIATLALDAVAGRGADIRKAFRELPRLVPSMAVIFAAELAAVMLAGTIIQGFLGPQFGVLAVWLAGLYFLAMVPVILVDERARASAVLRRGIRAARLPGGRHFSLVMVYFAFILWVSSISPVGSVAPATPSIPVWAYAMVASFLHVGFMGSLAYRWLAVKDQVPLEAPQPAKK